MRFREFCHIGSSAVGFREAVSPAGASPTDPLSVPPGEVAGLNPGGAASIDRRDVPPGEAVVVPGFATPIDRRDGAAASVRLALTGDDVPDDRRDASLVESVVEVAVVVVVVLVAFNPLDRVPDDLLVVSEALPTPDFLERPPGGTALIPAGAAPIDRLEFVVAKSPLNLRDRAVLEDFRLTAGGVLSVDLLGTSSVWGCKTHPGMEAGASKSSASSLGSGEEVAESTGISEIDWGSWGWAFRR